MRASIVVASVALAAASVALAAVDGPPDTQTVLAAGDIATCSGHGDERTAAILRDQPGTILALGDLAPAGELARCYGPSWGQFRARTRPVAGEREYANGLSAYRRYFGLRRTYYAFDLGAWRVYALDSENVSRAQLAWLRRDLATHPRTCVLAYWHRPLFSSGVHGGDGRMWWFWQALHDAGADVVLNAHDADYERFSRLDEGGWWDWFHGIRQFVVGTGGQDLRHDRGTTDRTSAIQWWTDGVLRLRLGERGYSWTYLAANHEFEDFGGENCRQP